MSSAILNARFNQDVSYVSVATEKGFRIHRVEPLKKPVCCCSREYVPVTPAVALQMSAKKDLANIPGGLNIAEMHYKSNLIALVGGGKYPKFSTNKVRIWDDFAGQSLLELEFHSQVLNVKTSKSRYFRFSGFNRI
jgi:hypothetical protein